MEVEHVDTTIYLHSYYDEHELKFNGQSCSYLEIQVPVCTFVYIQKTLPIPYRTKVLGRAPLFQKNRSQFDALSGNAEAFVATFLQRPCHCHLLAR
jgi:hypothetical protein